MTDQDLIELCNGLPHLEELAIDIYRDKYGNDWPYGTLDIIARFTRIRTVQPGLEVDDQDSTLKALHFTLSATGQLFGLHERNETYGVLSYAPVIDRTSPSFTRTVPGLSTTPSISCAKDQFGTMTHGTRF